MSIIEIGLTEKVYPDMLNAVPYYILKYQLLKQTGLMLKSIFLPQASVTEIFPR
jgi:hypothetical protein